MPSLQREIVRRIGDTQDRAEALERGEPEPFRGCKVYRNTTQSISNGALTPVAYTRELWDKGGCWSAAVSTHVIAPRAAYYLIVANVGWNNTDTDGDRYLQAYDQDGNVLGSEGRSGISDAGQLLVASAHLAQGDYVVIKVYQDSGSSLNISAASTANQHLNSVQFIRLP